MITQDQLKDVLDRADALNRYLDIDRKKIEFEEEDLRTQAPDFWDDPVRAQEQMKLVKGIKKWIDGYAEVRTAADELQLAFDFYKDELVTEEEVDSNYEKAISAIEALELRNMLRQDEDPMECVLKINSGAGGTEAQDWAAMLMRMYQRWAEKGGYKVTVSDLQEGDEAGIKSVTMQIEGGEYAYGFLKSENGVHRLVRVSPFDANARRQTSFASMETVAEIADDIDVEIKDEDLRIDTYRSGGAGGQHVNKTDSAVRLTHLPTGIVVACQKERSQHMNKEKAMNMLRAQLYEYYEDQKKAEMDRFYGAKSENGWGSQIRSYVFCPYTMVKDLRTETETSDVNGVMDGHIQPFIEAWLQMKAAK